jgi:putative transposase
LTDTPPDYEAVDVYFQAKRDGAPAKRFFKRLLRSHWGGPRKIDTDKLRSYGVAHRELSGVPSPDVIHDTSHYANNRAEQSHEATRVRERGKRKFKSVKINPPAATESDLSIDLFAAKLIHTSSKVVVYV